MAPTRYFLLEAKKKENDRSDKGVIYYCVIQGEPPSMFLYHRWLCPTL